MYSVSVCFVWLTFKGPWPVGPLLPHAETSQLLKFNECGLQLVTMKRLKSQQVLNMSYETKYI